MLKIRLQRTGRKNEPTFRLVLTDSKNSAKSGRFLEVLGNFDSRKGEKAEFKGERISHWMSVGAQVSDTVHNLLVDKKLLTSKKINKLPKKSAPVKVVEPEAPAPAPVAQAKEEESPKEEVMEAAPEVVEETPVTEVAPVEETPAPTPTEEAPATEEVAA